MGKAIYIKKRGFIIMFISFKKEFIFFHVYKTGGTSIYKSLDKYIYKPNILLNKLAKIGNEEFYDNVLLNIINNGHIKAKEAQQNLPPNIFYNYFKFAFVRNPWDIQVSLYHYMLKNKKHFQHKMVKELGSFDRYIEWRVNNEVRLQKDFLYDKNDNLLVDYVGKIENIENDFQIICDKLKINDVNLLHKNKSNHKSYHKYYNEKTKTMIAQAYKDDIEVFNYEY
jgi:hypothetical protein